MIKKIIQSLTVASFMFGCLYFADYQTVPESAQPIVAEVKAIDREAVLKSKGLEFEPVELEIVENDIPVVAEAEEPAYYIDVNDGYITEDSLISICEYVGDMYDISPELLQAITWVESRYKVDAVSSCNAKGLTQVMEKWNRDRIDRLGVTDLYDPYSSILLCADIISELRETKYGEDISYVLMAYNMGATGAKKPYESGNISTYAKKVLEKTRKLELEHDKL